MALFYFIRCRITSTRIHCDVNLNKIIPVSHTVLMNLEKDDVGTTYF